MKKYYSEILSNLKDDGKGIGLNDRVLLIDGLNTFIRSFVMNPSTNEDGIHVGGIKGFLLSIGYAIKQIKQELYGEFGYDTCSNDEKFIVMSETIKLLQND